MKLPKLPVVADPAYCEEHAGTVEIWSLGNPTFPTLEAGAPAVVSGTLAVWPVCARIFQFGRPATLHVRSAHMRNSHRTSRRSWSVLRFGTAITMPRSLHSIDLQSINCNHFPTGPRGPAESWSIHRELRCRLVFPCQRRHAPLRTRKFAPDAPKGKPYDFRSAQALGFDVPSAAT
jgi:hypothetical protein